MITRRNALKSTLIAATAASVAPSTLVTPPVAAASITLPALPYPADALEPHIDAQTMQIHHDKHHQAYLTNLNKALAENPDLANRTVESLLANLDAVPEKVRPVIRNHGGGHVNHAFFWPSLRKNQGAKPGHDLGKAIDDHFKNFAGFQQAFTEAATRQFGSGWAWLCLDPKGHLIVESTPNQDSPISRGHTPLLGLDVWEHAYYLKYQNRRPDYIAAFFQIIDWDVVAERFAKSRG